MIRHACSVLQPASSTKLSSSWLSPLRHLPWCFGRHVSGRDIGPRHRLDAVDGRRDFPPPSSLQQSLEMMIRPRWLAPATKILPVLRAGGALTRSSRPFGKGLVYKLLFTSC
jgi:hypothetical protein